MQPVRIAVASMLLMVAGSAQAATRINVVIGTEPPQLVEFAADELAGQLAKLFDAETMISADIPDAAENVILLGNPDTNRAIADALADAWPKLTDQGIMLRSIDRDGRPTLIVGGGSPVAVLWAVYELGYRHDIRYLPSGDYYPATPLEFTLAGHDAVMEPVMRERAWRTLDGGPVGGEAWGLADQQRLTRQLAKLKFNRVVLQIEADRPFFHYELRGAETNFAELFDGRLFPIDSETAGRKSFPRSMTEFTNPDFVGAKNYQQMTAAGISLARGIIDAAHEVGMTAALEIDPLDVPWEFRALEKDAFTLDPDKERARITTAEQRQSAIGKQAVRARLRACLNIYSGADALYFVGESASPTNDSMLRDIAADRTLVGRTGVERIEVKVLNFNVGQLDRPDLPPLPVPGLAGRLTDAASKRKSSFFSVMAAMTGLAAPDESTSATGLVSLLAESGYDGFLAWGLDYEGLDPAIHYLSRASYDPGIQPWQACHDLYAPICGGSDAADRLCRSFDFSTQAKAQSLTPSADTPTIPAEAIKNAARLRSRAMDEAYRAHDNCAKGSRPLLFYYCKTNEFELHLLTMLEFASTDKEKTIEALYSALTARSDACRSPCDRGAIAQWNITYRRLLTEYEATTPAE